LRKIPGNNKHCVVLSSDIQKPLLLPQTRLDNMFVTEEAFVVFKYMNNAG